MKALFFCLGIIGLFLPKPVESSVFQKIDEVTTNKIVKIIAAISEKNIVYVSGEKVVWRGDLDSNRWQKVISTNEDNIVDIASDCLLPDTIYVLTNSTLYRIAQGQKDKVFTLPPETLGYSLLVEKNFSIIGTDKGFFYYTPVKGWQRNILNEQKVLALISNKNKKFFATQEGIYLAEEGFSAQRKLVFFGYDQEEDENVDILPWRFWVDKFDSKKIFLATNRGCYYSDNEGQSWDKLILPGLDNLPIYQIGQNSQEKNTIYFASSKGLLRLDWQENTLQYIYEGLPSYKIYSLLWLDNGLILVGCSKGLYKQIAFSYYRAGKNSYSFLDQEPTIREIQEAALHYNEVHPDKIKKWRKRVKYRALFPQLDVSYDKTIYGSYTNGGQFAVGPRDWGINLSWDIADLIWNSYEDDIDSRSKLITQLRISILDDINSIYFQRLRLKQKIINSEKENADDIIRLKELTAMLDGYTGGFFSKRCRQIQENKRSEEWSLKEKR